MRKKLLKFASIGFLMGLFIGNLIAWLTSSGTYSMVSDALVARTGSEAAAVIVQTLLSGVLGAIAMGGVCFYDIEEWSLLRAALTHYLTIMISFVPVALFLGWVRSDHFLADWGIIAAGQTVSYLIIFIILCAVYRKEVRELNRMIEDRRGESEKDDKKA